MGLDESAKIWALANANRREQKEPSPKKKSPKKKGQSGIDNDDAEQVCLYRCSCLFLACRSPFVSHDCVILRNKY